MPFNKKITYTSLLLADEQVHAMYEEALEKVSEKYFGKHYPIYIGGGEFFSPSGEFEDRSPIDTSILIGYFQRSNVDHIREAISIAKQGFKEWSRTDWRDRVKIMRRAAELVDERKYEIAAVVTYEVGKNRMEALAECWEVIDTLNYYAKIMEENNGYELKLELEEVCRMVAKPYGVWVVISPFNFPLMLANGMIVGALITGNTVVFKPSSDGPLTGLLLYKIFIDAGVPGEAINYLTGPGDVFEDEIVMNKDVAGIAFTGSREVGMRLYKRFTSSQPYPKPVILEMGSKNPTIVTSKADVKKAVQGVIRAAFGYGGQKCSATSRVYVQKDIKDRFIEELIRETKNLKVGDPRKREVFLGPVVNKRAYENFMKYVETAKRDGGHILFGGHVLVGGEYDKGYYVLPTIITGLRRDHELFKNELFLPILLIDTFDTLEEAIAEANNTDYGLTAGIFSEDEEEINYFFERIEFGVVYANRRGGATTGAWPGLQTFVGWKASGSTGKGLGGPNYLLTYIREQSRTIVKEKS
ncbi:MAG: aldehyde dehydrogenase family protein [Aigarchaeota archaeon]|nr:aldehyde dehydrogenase family protein [Aigarchaeota archaeon]